MGEIKAMITMKSPVSPAPLYPTNPLPKSEHIKPVTLANIEKIITNSGVISSFFTMYLLIDTNYMHNILHYAKQIYQKI